MTIPPFGTSISNCNLITLLNDNLNTMGDYFNSQVGSLNWCECLVDARDQEAAYNLLNIMSRQLNPATATVWLDRWATIYNTAGAADVVTIQSYIGTLQKQFGTPPNLNNIRQYLAATLGNIFLDIQYNPENQYLATTDPYQDLIVEKLQYNQPLAVFFIYVWQPRDNQDNVLLNNAAFNQLVNGFQQIMQNWLPHYAEIITMNLVNRGNQDGYAGGYNGLNYNNYLDGYNVVSGTAGSTTLTGVGTTFTNDFFPQAGNSVDVPFSINRTPPIQIVDDTNMVQTYYVASITNDTSMTLTQPLINNITSRTYRTLGIVYDTSGMFDNSALFNT